METDRSSQPTEGDLLERAPELDGSPREAVMLPQATVAAAVQGNEGGEDAPVEAPYIGDLAPRSPPPVAAAAGSESAQQHKSQVRELERALRKQAQKTSQAEREGAALRRQMAEQKAAEVTAMEANADDGVRPGASAVSNPIV